MNIIFMDGRFVKPENWQYLADVLKIKEIFIFNESNELISQLEHLNSKNISISYQGTLNDEEFSKKITFRISNLIKSSVPSFSKLPEDLSERYPFCNKSKRFTPIGNLFKTQDNNFLVLGNVDWICYNESIFIRHVSKYRDMAADIIQFALNIIKRQLNTDVYRDRICSYMINSISGEEFLLTRYGWRKPQKRFLPIINTLLRQSYPQIFPSQNRGGKIVATPFYNIELLETHRVKWRKHLDKLRQEKEMERQAWLDEEQAREDAEDERRMIDNCWRELGENRWNID